MGKAPLFHHSKAFAKKTSAVLGASRHFPGEAKGGGGGVYMPDMRLVWEGESTEHMLR